MKAIALFTRILGLTLIGALLWSCQSEHKSIQKMIERDLMLKSALDQALTLNYPDHILPNTDFEIEISSTCGQLILERGFVLGDDGSSRIYRGLSSENTDSIEFEKIGEVKCSGGKFKEKWDKYGTYLYRVTLDPMLGQATQDGCSVCPKGSLSEKAYRVFDVRICRVATAFGGDKVLEGPSKWQIFDTKIVAKAGNLDWVQDISADGNMVIGSVIYDGINLTIDLNDDWILYEGVNEPVKVEGLASEPSRPLPADKFRLYKGTDLSLDLSELRANGLRYYAIHLDVQTSNPANF